MKVKFSFSKKLVALFFIPLFLIGAIVASLSAVTLRDNLNAEILEGLQLAAVSLETTYSTLYEGDYVKDKGGNLYKGETKLTGNTVLLDTLKEKSGVDTTFYFGNKIVITTLKTATGARAVGLDMEKELYQRIQSGETVFEPEYELQKSTYYGYFLPLLNSDGSVVGAIFAGRPASEVSNQINEQLMKILFPTLGVMLVFMVIILLFARTLTRSMKRTRKFLEKVSGGDLVVGDKEKVVKNRDEIGDIYRISEHLRSELRGIVSKMKVTADLVSGSAGELMTMSKKMHGNAASLHESVEDIKADTSVQAEKTVESVDSISHIGTQIELISKEMESMNETVSGMSEAERKSSLLMQELNASNTEMAAITTKISEQIAATDASVQAIQQTIDIINAIADETDLLSTNASIGAAHAGSAGRGFAVIAEQINKLASQSGENARSVEKTIAALKENSEKMVATMAEVTERMGSQNEKMAESIENFGYVAKGVEASRAGVEKINSRMEELDRAKEIVLDCVRSLSEIADKLVSSMDVIADTAGSMDERTKKLESTVASLEDISEKLNSGLDIFKL